MTIHRPTKLAHVVYRTRRFEDMLNWYRTVFDAKVQHRNPAMAFLTFDDEHHRFAFLDLAAVDPEGSDAEGRTWTGVDHLAWSLESLEGLMGNYTELKRAGIEPYWCVHHGLTISMYYADPDGNQMEFQVDAFDAAEDCNEYINGPSFEVNPVGVEFDPEAWITAIENGASIDDFRVRTVHEPVSSIRGQVAELF